MSQAKSLSKNFFRNSTLEIAQKLLGSYLAHYTSEGVTIGKIVETEAYLHKDPACHASRGMTPRNAPMFGPSGHAYIYFIYGMYHCFNVVTAPTGKGEAVLIRALEPILGIEWMKKRREKKTGKVLPLKELCNGPGKLVIAMGIHPQQNRHNLFTSELRLLPQNYFGKLHPVVIQKSPRIGIREGQNLHYRFYLANSIFVSKHPKI